MPRGNGNKTGAAIPISMVLGTRQIQSYFSLILCPLTFADRYDGYGTVPSQFS